jgi:hypothetical protein
MPFAPSAAACSRKREIPSAWKADQEKFSSSPPGNRLPLSAQCRGGTWQSFTASRLIGDRTRPTMLWRMAQPPIKQAASSRATPRQMYKQKWPPDKGRPLCVGKLLGLITVSKTVAPCPVRRKPCRATLLWCRRPERSQLSQKASIRKGHNRPLNPGS